MSEHLFFDCNAAIGPFPRKHREARWSKEHLLEGLDLAGIAGALVHHRLALNYDPMFGNRKLVEEIEGDRGRLYPCWVVLPDSSGEFLSVRELMSELEQHDVRAVRIQSQLFGVPETEGIWGELRDALLERDLLCVLPTPGYSRSIDGFERILEIFRNDEVVPWREFIVDWAGSPARKTDNLSVLRQSSPPWREFIVGRAGSPARKTDNLSVLRRSRHLAREFIVGWAGSPARNIRGRGHGSNTPTLQHSHPSNTPILPSLQHSHPPILPSSHPSHPPILPSSVTTCPKPLPLRGVLL